MKLKTALTMLGVVSLLATAAKADDLADVKTAGQINVGIFSDFPPFSSASSDMSLKGYDIDVAQAIATALGVKLNLLSVTGQNRIAYLNDKRVDIIMSVGYSKERAAVIDFAAAYAPWLKALLIDAGDAGESAALARAGVRAVSADIMMTDRAREVALARRVLEAA